MDVNSLFARAEQAFAAGRLDAARADLAEVRRLAGDHPAVLHLLALVEKKRGDGPAARAAFESALAAAPRDHQIRANFANFLSEMGESEGALAEYGRALAIAPGFHDARYNRALVLQRLGRLDEALADLDAVAAARPGDARVQSARGGVLRALERLDDAAAAYDSALAAAPRRVTALHGRARVAMERGEEIASSLYKRALEEQPGDEDLLLGLAEALEAEGDPAGVELLREAIARRPDWAAGYEILARIRAEAGAGADFADHYLAALAERPADRELHQSYWSTLSAAGRHSEALDALRRARPGLVEDEGMILLEAMLASESGSPEEALALLDRPFGTLSATDLGFTRGRAALRAGLPDRAALELEAATAAEPDFINGWAHLDLAWRLCGDARHEWLSGRPGLHDSHDLLVGEKELARLAELLRGLHRTRAHPIGQSLRGGTQTRGRLFSRTEIEIRRIAEAIERAVGEHFDRLPPLDEAHPLLRHREREVRITGSWSVRLDSQGFHVNHVHPEGILSSACYISLPDCLGSGEVRDGWLELGRPPAELGLALEPIASIEPRPGRLALFPSYLFHGTRPFADGERLTIAFDVAPR